MGKAVTAALMCVTFAAGCLPGRVSGPSEGGVLSRGIEPGGREVAIFAQLSMKGVEDTGTLRIALVNLGPVSVRLPAWWGESGVAVGEIYDPPVEVRDGRGGISKVHGSTGLVEVSKVFGSYDLGLGQCAVFECRVTLSHGRASLSQLQVIVSASWHRADGSEGSAWQEFIFVPGDPGVLRLRTNIRPDNQRRPRTPNGVLNGE